MEVCPWDKRTVQKIAVYSPERSLGKIRIKISLPETPVILLQIQGGKKLQAAEAYKDHPRVQQPPWRSHEGARASGWIFANQSTVLNEWMNLHPIPFFQQKVSGPYAETEIQGVKAVLLNIWRWCLRNPSYWKWWNLRVSRGNWVLPVFGSMAGKTRAKLNSSKWPVSRKM